MSQIRPVIWAKDAPIQFHSFCEGDSPFQEALERVSDIEFADPLIVAPECMRDVVIAQCDEIHYDYEDLIIRTDCAELQDCLDLVANWSEKKGETLPLLICPASHFIADQTAFMRAVGDAVHTVNLGYRVHFGVMAEFASTAQDYVEVGTRLDAAYSGHHLLSKVTLPNQVQAQDCLAARRFVWDTGILCTTLAQIRSKQDPEEIIVSLLSPWANLETWPGIWKALHLI